MGCKVSRVHKPGLSVLMEGFSKCLAYIYCSDYPLNDPLPFFCDLSPLTTHFSCNFADLHVMVCGCDLITQHQLITFLLTCKSLVFFISLFLRPLNTKSRCLVVSLV